VHAGNNRFAGARQQPQAQIAIVYQQRKRIKSQKDDQGRDRTDRQAEAKRRDGQNGLIAANPRPCFVAPGFAE